MIVGQEVFCFNSRGMYFFTHIMEILEDSYIVYKETPRNGGTVRVSKTKVFPIRRLRSIIDLRRDIQNLGGRPAFNRIVGEGHE
jgi:hypothetical protein